MYLVDYIPDLLVLLLADGLGEINTGDFSRKCRMERLDLK